MPDCDSASSFSSVFTGVSVCVETNTPINAVRGDAHRCNCPAIRPSPNAGTCDSVSFFSVMHIVP